MVCLDGERATALALVRMHNESVLRVNHGAVYQLVISYTAHHLLQGVDLAGGDVVDCSLGQQACERGPMGLQMLGGTVPFSMQE
jgi:hypothetical protein